MSKVILKSLFVIVVLLTIGTSSTNAYFSDSKVITGNVISTGTWEVEPPEPKKVDICHLEDKKGTSYHLISVSVNALDAHMAHGDQMPATMMGDDLWIDGNCAVWTYVETVTVPANGTNSVASLASLTNSGRYLFNAYGTAFAGDTIDFDAQYSLTNRIVGDTWTDSVSGYESYGPTLLDLFVDSGDVDWGAFNSDHSYWYDYMGNGSPVNFWVYDVYYPNNTGSLMVDIFELVE